MTQRVELATVMDRLAVDGLVTEYAVAVDDGDWEAYRRTVRAGRAGGLPVGGRYRGGRGADRRVARADHGAVPDAAAPDRQPAGAVRSSWSRTRATRPGSRRTTSIRCGSRDTTADQPSPTSCAAAGTTSGCCARTTAGGCVRWSSTRSGAGPRSGRRRRSPPPTPRRVHGQPDEVCERPFASPCPPERTRRRGPYRPGGCPLTEIVPVRAHWSHAPCFGGSREALHEAVRR